MPENITSASKLQTFPGKYRIHECAITIPPKNPEDAPLVVDIRHIFTSFHLYEDLFNNYLTAEITIDDPYNILEAVPIVGQEFFKFTYSDSYPNESEKITLYFNIVGISDRALTSERSQRYKLKLVSLEAVKNQNTKISRSFKGKITDLVEKIYREYLDQDKILYIDNSKYEVQFISPRWTPLQCINWLTQRAVDAETNKAGFVFFETRFGYNFASIHQMVKQTPYAEYSYEPAEILNAPRQINRIIDYNVIKGYETMEKLANGSLGSKLITIDHTNKSHKENSVNYQDFYLNTNHLEETRDKNNYPTWPYITPTNPESKFKVASNSSFVYENIPNNYIQDWYSSYFLSLRQFETQRLALNIVPNFDLSVGDLINVSIPSPVGPRPNKKGDEYLSGKYIITAIRRTFNTDKEIMILEVSKDSLQKSIVR